jgi:hypothetical protein
MFRILLPLLLALLSGLPVVRADDESSFATIPDVTWERIEPLKEIGLDLANFDFSAQTCRITCAVPPPELLIQLGAAAAPRANLLAPTEYPDAVASVDILSWQVPQPGLLDGSFPAVFSRIQPEAGFGKTTGFSLALQTLQGGLGRLRIYLAFQENLLQLGQSATFTLDPARSYRLVLASRGDRHTGLIFDLTNPATPDASLTIQNFNLTNAGGRCGFGVVMPHPLPIDVTFDNFLAWDGSPPPLAIRQGTALGTIELLSDTRRSMASALETTSDFSDPLATWLPAMPASATTSGETFIRVFPLNGPRAFFRGKSL